MIHESMPKGFSPALESVGCFVEYQRKIVLLLRQDDREVGPNCWGMPAGRVERAETPLEAVVREVREETGIDVPFKRMDYFKPFYVTYPEHDFIFHVFHTQLGSRKNIIIDPKEHKDYRWLSPRRAVEITPQIMNLDGFIRAYYTSVCYKK